MGILAGCEETNKTWNLEERVCPKCGARMEVYTLRGRVVEDAVCDRCGYVVKEQEKVIPEAKDKMTKE